MCLPGYFQRHYRSALYKEFRGEFYMSLVPLAWAHHHTSLWMRLVSPSFFSLASAAAVLMPSVSATIFTAVRATSCKADAPASVSMPPHLSGRHRQQEACAVLLEDALTLNPSQLMLWQPSMVWRLSFQQLQSGTNKTLV